jgi:hypothetical protein
VQQCPVQFQGREAKESGLGWGFEGLGLDGERGASARRHDTRHRWVGGWMDGCMGVCVHCQM